MCWISNQYETFRQSQQQSADNKVDEMLERLKELARRQEQEDERQIQAEVGEGDVGIERWGSGGAAAHGASPLPPTPSPKRRGEQDNDL